MSQNNWLDSFFVPPIKRCHLHDRDSCPYEEPPWHHTDRSLRISSPKSGPHDKLKLPTPSSSRSCMSEGAFRFFRRKAVHEQLRKPGPELLSLPSGGHALCRATRSRLYSWILWDSTPSHETLRLTANAVCFLWQLASTSTRRVCD